MSLWDPRQFQPAVPEQPPNGKVANRQFAAQVGSVLVVAYVALVTFSFTLLPLGSGLDNAWRYGLNLLPNSDYLFGRDVVFSYGPLGYLLYPMDLGSNLYQATGFSLIVQALFMAAVLAYVLRGRRLLQSSLFASSFVAASIVGLSFDSELLVIEALVLCLALEDSPVSLPAAVVAGCLGGTLLFVKFSLGLAPVATMGLAGIIAIGLRRRKQMRAILLVGLSFVVTVIIVALVCLKSLANLVFWLRASAEVATGYSQAMSQTAPADLLNWGLWCLAAYGLVSIGLLIVGSNLWSTATVLAPMVLVSFKEGFVRADFGHLMLFFPVVVALLGVLILVSDDRRGTALSFCAALVCFSISAIVVGQVAPITAASVESVLLAQSGRTNIASLIDLPQTRAQVAERSKDGLRPDRLPDSWVRAIRSSGGVVGSLPIEIGFAPANDLVWSPNGVMQTYSAYTAFLDQWSAERIYADTGPPYELVQFTDIDGRNPLLSEPAVWRALIHSYRLVDAHGPGGALLLSKVPGIGAAELSTVGRARVALGEQVTVPKSDRPMYALIDMKLSPGGRLQSLLYQVPPLYIDLLYESGRSASFRFIAETASNGIPVNFVPATTDDFVQLLEGEATDRVVSFSIYGPGSSLYDRAIDVTWLEAPQPLLYRPQSPPDFSRLTRAGTNTLYSIDTVNGQALPKPGTTIVIDAQKDTPIMVAGWAVDGRAQRAASGVFIDIDGDVDILATYGIHRPDVAAYFKNDQYALSGFLASISVHTLSKGDHTLSLRIVSADRQSYYQLGPVMHVDIR